MNEILGWCVCVAGTVYKVPQVLKIKRAKSADGVSLLFFGLDAISNVIELSYSYNNNHPFSKYGEVPSQLICSSSVFFQCLYYQKRVKKNVIAILAFAWVCVVSCACKLTSIRSDGLRILDRLKLMNVFVTCVGKVPQIITNARNGHSGQLSLTSTSLALLGNVVRIITGSSLGLKMISSQLASLVLNGILVLQILKSEKKKKLRNKVN